MYGRVRDICSSSYEVSEGEGGIVGHILGKLAAGRKHPSGRKHPLPSNDYLPYEMRITADPELGSYSLERKSLKNRVALSESSINF
jgi:hypothetical protein